MPLRVYECSKGCTWSQLESMNQDRATRCPHCGDRDVTRIIQSTQRPIVKSGTPLHHGRVGVE